MSTSSHKRARFTGAALLLLAAACDGSMSPIEDVDGGPGANGVPSGYCVEEPHSCEDLLAGDGEALEDCCFGEVRYWCQNGVLFLTECPEGCSYDAEVEMI